MASPDLLVSKRMKNLHWLSIGVAGFDATTGLALGGDTLNLSCATADASGNLITPAGVLASTKQDTDIDLGDTAICAESGVTIPAGRNIYLFIIQDGTNQPLVRLGEKRKLVRRSSATAALVTTYVYDVLPNDVDMSTYVCTGYAKLVNPTNVFTIGTTDMAEGTIVETFVELTRMMAGANIEG
jgi:hypothetical protein